MSQIAMQPLMDEWTEHLAPQDNDHRVGAQHIGCGYAKATQCEVESRLTKWRVHHKSGDPVNTHFFP